MHTACYCFSADVNTCEHLALINEQYIRAHIILSGKLHYRNKIIIQTLKKRVLHPRQIAVNVFIVIGFYAQRQSMHEHTKCVFQLRDMPAVFNCAQQSKLLPRLLCKSI